jgi:hypothetical protein
MIATVNEVIGANVARLRHEQDMTQMQLIYKLKPYTGIMWSRQTLGNGENGRHTWTTQETIAVALIFNVQLTELFTPAPEQSGDLRISDRAEISRGDYMLCVASRPATVQPVFIDQLVQASERLATLIRDIQATINTQEDPA